MCACMNLLVLVVYVCIVDWLFSSLSLLWYMSHRVNCYSFTLPCVCVCWCVFALSIALLDTTQYCEWLSLSLSFSLCLSLFCNSNKGQLCVCVFRAIECTLKYIGYAAFTPIRETVTVKCKVKWKRHQVPFPFRHSLSLSLSLFLSPFHFLVSQCLSPTVSVWFCFCLTWLIHWKEREELSHLNCLLSVTWMHSLFLHLMWSRNPPSSLSLGLGSDSLLSMSIVLCTCFSLSLSLWPSLSFSLGQGWVISSKWLLLLYPVSLWLVRLLVMF